MKTVFVCAPAIGNYVESLAMADSICKMAQNQGHFSVIGRLPMPGDEANQKLQEIQLRQCEEVWLYYDGRRFRRDLLVDLDRAAAAGKAIRLVKTEILPESRRLAAASLLAADSYADAPGRDNGSDVEAGQDEVREVEEPQLNIDRLLLALKGLGEILDEAALQVAELRAAAASSLKRIAN
jgi:hypothetical protein